MHFHEHDPEEPEPHPRMGATFAAWFMGAVLVALGVFIGVQRPDLLGPAIILVAGGGVIIKVGNWMRDR